MPHKDVLGLDPNKLTVDSPVPYVLGDPAGLNEFGELGGAKYDIGLVRCDQRTATEQQKQEGSRRLQQGT